MDSPKTFNRTFIHILHILALVLIGVNLAGCGATKQSMGSTDLGSLELDGPVADCNGARDTSLKLEFRNLNF